MSSFSAMRVLVSSIRASHRRGIHICQWCRTSHDELLWKGSWVNLGIIRKIPQPELPSHITKISYFPPFKVSLKLWPMRWCIFPRFFCGKPSGRRDVTHYVAVSSVNIKLPDSPACSKLSLQNQLFWTYGKQISTDGSNQNISST